MGRGEFLSSTCGTSLSQPFLPYRVRAAEQVKELMIGCPIQMNISFRFVANMVIVILEALFRLGILVGGIEFQVAQDLFYQSQAGGILGLNHPLF